MYGLGNSIAKHEKSRKAQYFETNEECRKRTAQTRAKIEEGVKMPKNHVGNTQSYNIDDEGLKGEASSWTEDFKPNFQGLGRRHITAKDGKNKNISNVGQVAKKRLLELENDDPAFSFTFKGKNNECKPRERRARKRSAFGSRLSDPCDVSGKIAKQELDELVREGKLKLGVAINQREIVKNAIVSDDDGFIKVVQKTITTSGRMFPLSDIRREIFEENKQFMRLNPRSYFENITEEEVINRLKINNQLHKYDGSNISEMIY